MRVLVLDGNENQAVAATRSLSRAGHRVCVGADTSWSKAGWSRACSTSFRYPAAERDADAFVECVASEASREPGTLVLPMTERTTLPLSAARETVLGAGGLLVLPSHDRVLRAFDKGETTALARAVGADVPWTAIVSTQAEARAAAIRYPLVLKPRSSEEYTSGFMRATGAPVFARNEAELLRGWKDLARRCQSALIQEFIPGAGVGYFALMRDGELCAEFAHRRIRDVRPTGSGSSLRVSIAVPPRVRDAALAILSALQWHGVAMVEFRVRPDGTPTFLEVNGRFWNSLALPIAAGVDFPALVADLAARGDVPQAGPYRVGARCRWLIGDLRHLAEVWRGAPPGYPGEFPSRMRTLASFLTPVRGTSHDNFTLRDPLPELGDWLHFATRRLPRRVRRRPTEILHVEGRPSHS